PAFARGIRFGKEDEFAHFVCARSEHERCASLSQAGEVEEVILLAKGPFHVAGVVARFGCIEDQDAMRTDFVHDGFPARSQVRDTVALPGSGRRGSRLPRAVVGGKRNGQKGKGTERAIHRTLPPLYERWGCNSVAGG